MADDLQALRTAISFNDREMSLDYRSVGTRDLHAGTFTAASLLHATQRVWQVTRVVGLPTFSCYDRDILRRV